MLYTRNNAHTPRCRKRLALHGGRKEERTGMGEGKERKRGEETCSLKGGECEVRVKKQEHKVSNGGEYSRECKRTKQGQLFYPFHDVTRVISRYINVFMYLLSEYHSRDVQSEERERKKNIDQNWKKYNNRTIQFIFFHLIFIRKFVFLFNTFLLFFYFNIILTKWKISSITSIKQLITPRWMCNKIRSHFTRPIFFSFFLFFSPPARRNKNRNGRINNLYFEIEFTILYRYIFIHNDETDMFALASPCDLTLGYSVGYFAIPSTFPAL